MKHMSYWMDTAKPPRLPVFDGEKTCDVAVIGAGLTGITTALLLSLQGVKTIVIDADKVASGTTGKTTAKITVQHGLKYQYLSLEKAFGYLRANMAGYNKIEEIINENSIECDYEHVPSFVYTRDPSEIKYIEDELEAYDKLGLPSNIISDTSLPFGVIRAIELQSGAQFHPVKYIYALTKMLLESGSEVFEHAKVVDIEKGSPVIIHTDRGSLTAENVVIATNYPLVEFPGGFFLKLHQERSYIISTDSNDTEVNGIYINAGRPVHSVRTYSAKGARKLLLGGFGHKTGLEDDDKNAYDSLTQFLQSDFIKANQKPQYGWSSQDCVTLDEIPYIGEISKKHGNLYVATGYAKWGMTNATAAAMMLTDMITDTHMIDKEVRRIFNPLRIDPGASAKNFFAQTANTVKEFTAGNVTIPIAAYDDIPPGKGAVIRVEGKAQAVYKHEDGKVSAFSAHCTHLGCPLEYNEVENSFDCGCHGSRFAVDGSVLEGPAKRPLDCYSEDEE